MEGRLSYEQYKPKSHRKHVSIRQASCISQCLRRSINNYLVHLENSDSCLQLKIWTFEDYCLERVDLQEVIIKKNSLVDNVLYSYAWIYGLKTTFRYTFTTCLCFTSYPIDVDDLPIAT